MGQRYIYEGPVMVFDICVANIWKGETIAPSEKRARSNLAYQYKKANNLCASARINLPGKLKAVIK